MTRTFDRPTLLSTSIETFFPTFPCSYSSNYQNVYRWRLNKLDNSKSTSIIFINHFPNLFSTHFLNSVLFIRCSQRCPALLTVRTTIAIQIWNFLFYRFYSTDGDRSWDKTPPDLLSRGLAKCTRSYTIVVIYRGPGNANTYSRGIRVCNFSGLVVVS